jgi:EF hand
LPQVSIGSTEIAFDRLSNGEIMRHLAIFLALTAVLGIANAQTIVPRLDETGSRGDIARKMKAKSAVQFDAADANKDGKLSKAELATVSDYYVSNFEKLDTNKDGFLSWEEFVGHSRWPK